MSEEEEVKIVERVEFETHVRKQLAGAKPSTDSPLWAIESVIADSHRPFRYAAAG